MTKSILVKLPEPVWKAFRTLAIDRGVSNARLVEQLLAEHDPQPRTFTPANPPTREQAIQLVARAKEEGSWSNVSPGLQKALTTLAEASDNSPVVYRATLAIRAP